MASGDAANPSAGTISYILLDAVGTGATNDGVWIDCAEYHSGTVIVTGPATTTVVQVQGHNGVTKPANNVAGGVITAGSAGTNVYSSIPVLPKWLKAAITATGTGTVTAVALLRKL